MKLICTSQSIADYQYWKSHDRRVVRRINQLLKTLSASEGEKLTDLPLSGSLVSWRSRRVTRTDCMVYRVKDGSIEILQLRRQQ